MPIDKVLCACKPWALWLPGQQQHGRLIPMQWNDDATISWEAQSTLLAVFPTPMMISSQLIHRAAPQHIMMQCYQIRVSADQ